MARFERSPRPAAPPPTCVSQHGRQRQGRGPLRPDVDGAALLADGMSRYPQVQAERHVSLESMYFRDCFSRGYRLLGQQLGRGSYAKVRLALIEKDKHMERATYRQKLNKLDIEKVAVKIVDKRLAPRAYSNKVLPREIAAHRMVSGSRFVVELVETFETPTHFYCIFENCSNGNLLNYVNVRSRADGGGLPEACARKLFQQLCDAVDHCHSRNVVHRNIRCENLLLDDDLNLKLSDFSVSALVPANYKLLKRPCGSFSYAAPELLNHQVYEGALIDAWSVGVVLYAMLNRCLPFSALNADLLYEDMRNHRFRFHRTISTEAMVLVRDILQADPCRRLSIPEIQQSAWYRGLKIPLLDIYEALEQGQYSVTTPVGRQQSLTLPIPDYRAARGRSQHTSVSVGAHSKETIHLKSKMPDKHLAYAVGYDHVTRTSGCHMSRHREDERGGSMLQLEVIHSPADWTTKSATRCPTQGETGAFCVRGRSASHILTRSAAELDAMQARAPPGYRVIDDSTCQLICDCGRPIVLKVKEVHEDGSDLTLEMQQAPPGDGDDPNPPAASCKNSEKLWIAFEDRLREIQKYIEDTYMKPSDSDSDSGSDSDSESQGSPGSIAAPGSPVSEADEPERGESPDDRGSLSSVSENLDELPMDEVPPAPGVKSPPEDRGPVVEADRPAEVVEEQLEEEEVAVVVDEEHDGHDMEGLEEIPDAGPDEGPEEEVTRNAFSAMDEEDLPATPADLPDEEHELQRAKSAFAGQIGDLTGEDLSTRPHLRGCKSHLSDVSLGMRTTSYSSYGPTSEGNCAVLSKLSDSVIAKLVAIETIMMSNHRTASQLSFLKKELLNESKRNPPEPREQSSQQTMRGYRDVDSVSQASDLGYTTPMRPYLTSTDPSLQNRMSIYDKDARRQNRRRGHCGNHSGTETESNSLRDFRLRRNRRASPRRLHLPPLDVSTMPKFANTTSARLLLESRPKCRMGQFDPSSTFTKQYLYMQTKVPVTIPYSRSRAVDFSLPLTRANPSPRCGVSARLAKVVTEEQKEASKPSKAWQRVKSGPKGKSIEDVRRMLGHVPSTMREPRHRSMASKMME